MRSKGYKNLVSCKALDRISFLISQFRYPVFFSKRSKKTNIHRKRSGCLMLLLLKPKAPANSSAGAQKNDKE